MLNRERIVWLLVSCMLFSTCIALWYFPRHTGSASESKELSNVRHVAGQAAIFAEYNNGRLPRRLSDLFPDHLQLGREDRNLIYELSGNREVPPSVQRYPSLLRYAIVAGKEKAIVHQIPDSNDYRNKVWQHLIRVGDKWQLDGSAIAGSFADLSTAIEAILQDVSEQTGASNPHPLRVEN